MSYWDYIEHLRISHNDSIDDEAKCVETIISSVVKRDRLKQKSVGQPKPSY